MDVTDENEEQHSQGRKFEEIFSMSEVIFNEMLLPIFIEDGFVPKFVLQFVIELPFQLPFPQSTTLSICKDNNSLCHYEFLYDDIQEEKTDIKKGFPIFKSNKTRVEISYIDIVDAPTEIETDFLSEKFDFALETLNKILLSYIICQRDSTIYKVEKESLNPICFYRLIDIAGWKQIKKGILTLNWNVPVSKKMITEKEFHDISFYAKVIERDENPFIISENFVYDARRYLNTGAYKEAIILAQTATEIFITRLLIKLWECDNTDLKDIDKKLKNLSFKNMLKKELHSRLGGNWNLDDLNGTVGIWYKGAYLLRNRVVHGGIQPTFKETMTALSETVNFRNFIVDRLKTKKDEYSEVIKYFI